MLNDMLPLPQPLPSPQPGPPPQGLPHHQALAPEPLTASALTPSIAASATDLTILFIFITPCYDSLRHDRTADGEGTHRHLPAGPDVASGPLSA
jgi:hypothetical protein